MAGPLTAGQAKQLFRELPYQYRFREVPLPAEASGAVAGRATGPEHVAVQFGVALGGGHHSVAVGKAGTGEAFAVSFPDGDGFIYTTDLQFKRDGKWVLNPRYKDAHEEHLANVMIVAMEEKLCKAATGRPCPI